MKAGSKTFRLVILFVAVLCFISLPVLAENPWDADANPGGGGMGKTSSDTTALSPSDQPDGGDASRPALAPSYQFDPFGNEADWFSNLLFNVSLEVTTWLYGDDVIATAQQVKVHKAHSSQKHRKLVR